MDPIDNSQPVKLTKVIVPVILSLTVSVYLFVHGFKPSVLHTVHFTLRLAFGLLLALLALLIRDLCFIYKVRLSSGYKLGWKKCLQTIILWEFGAAITPKLSEVATTLFVLKRNGLSYGRSTGVIVLNSFMDNAVFAVAFAVLYFALGPHILQVDTNCADLGGGGTVGKVMGYVRSLAHLAWIGYGIFCFLALFFGVAIFVLPAASKRFFYRVADARLLSRFKNTFTHLGDEIEIVANEFKGQSWIFWVKLSAATFLNWTMRFLIVNALVFSFNNNVPNMWDVFARQWVLWIFLVIPTTPGSSGWAEISFIAINCEFIPPGLAAAVVLIWRIYTYYLYLVAGLIILPGWLSKTENQPAISS